MLNTHPHQLQATLIGSIAILLWGISAVLTKLSGNLPPFQLIAMAFFMPFLMSLGVWYKQGGSILHHLHLPKTLWLIGVGGIFGNYFFYFVAFQNAPAGEAILLISTWPLMVVLFSTLLPNERLRWFHGIGVLIGFIGIGAMLNNEQGLNFSHNYILGYLSAFTCALIWSAYSVLSRQFGNISSTTVGGFCGVGAILALICHLLFEETVQPVGIQWLAILMLGLGPLGIAFFAWDYGIKHGNIKFLGGASYLISLFSVLSLIVFKFTEATQAIGIASICIIGGAIFASGDFFNKKQPTLLVNSEQ